MKIAGLILSSTLAGAALATVPTTSFAGSSLCAASRVCIYDHANWVGQLGERAAGGGNKNVTTAANDLTSSWENKTSTNARWHVDANSNGTCRNMAKKTESYYINPPYNDKLTSWATNGGC